MERAAVVGRLDEIERKLDGAEQRTSAAAMITSYLEASNYGLYVDELNRYRDQYVRGHIEIDEFERLVWDELVRREGR